MNTIPRLMFVTDCDRTARPQVELVAAAVRGGVDAIQLRAPAMPRSEIVELAIRLRGVIADRAALLINGEVGIAAELGLGVHLPEAGMALGEARRQLGEMALIGRSVHSAAAATAAVGADYLIAGNVYATASHPGRAPLGLAGLRVVVTASWAPVLAIGGITRERVDEVMRAGVHGVAVIGAIAEADNPERAAAELRSAIAVWGEDEMEPNGTVAMAPATLGIVVNGKPVTIPADSTITDFLVEKGLQPQMAIVELNGTVIARRVYDDTWLADGDQLEVVHAVGGG